MSTAKERQIAVPATGNPQLEDVLRRVIRLLPESTGLVGPAGPAGAAGAPGANGAAGAAGPAGPAGGPLPGADAATHTALPAHANVAGVLTASANGALPTQDGVTTLAVGQTLAVLFDGADVGLYTVTSLGSGGSKWVLTRRADLDTAGDFLVGTSFAVAAGNIHGGKTYILRTTGTIVVNTTPLTFLPPIERQIVVRGTDYGMRGDLVVDNTPPFNAAKTGGKAAVLACTGENGGFAMAFDGGAYLFFSPISVIDDMTNGYERCISLIGPHCGGVDAASKPCHFLYRGSSVSGTDGVLGARSAIGVVQFTSASATFTPAMVGQWLYTENPTSTVYNNATAYTVGQVVNPVGVTQYYRCILNSTGNAVTNTTYWLALNESNYDSTLVVEYIDAHNIKVGHPMMAGSEPGPIAFHVSSPFLTVKSRGVHIEGIQFDCLNGYNTHALLQVTRSYGTDWGVITNVRSYETMYAGLNSAFVSNNVANCVSIGDATPTSLVATAAPFNKATTYNIGDAVYSPDYNNATTYAIGDCVLNPPGTGSSYRCILGTTGNAPPNATYWVLMSAAPNGASRLVYVNATPSSGNILTNTTYWRATTQRFSETWDVDRVYTNFDIVWYATTSKYYQYINGVDTAGNLPTNASYWLESAALAPQNCDYIYFSQCQLNYGANAIINIPNNTQQVKNVRFENGGATQSKYFFRVVAGSFRTLGPGVSWMTKAIASCASSVDEIAFDYTDSEKCSRHWVSAGSQQGNWVVSITGGRYSLDQIATDGNWFSFGWGGPVNFDKVDLGYYISAFRISGNVTWDSDRRTVFNFNGCNFANTTVADGGVTGSNNVYWFRGCSGVGPSNVPIPIPDKCVVSYSDIYHCGVNAVDMRAQHRTYSVVSVGVNAPAWTAPVGFGAWSLSLGSDGIVYRARAYSDHTDPAGGANPLYWYPDIRLQPLEFSEELIKLTGALVSNTLIGLPNDVWIKRFWNATTVNFTLKVGPFSGTMVEVPQGRVATVASDGTNAVLVGIDELPGYLSVSIAGGATTTLTAAQYNAKFVDLIGVVTANKDVIIMGSKYVLPKRVRDSSTGGFVVTFKPSTGTGVALTAGKVTDVEFDGTNAIIGAVGP